MKSTLVLSSPPKTLPKLMRHRHLGFVVLFTTSCKGTVVFENETNYQLGYNSSWEPATFEDFDGTVTLSTKDA